MSRGFEARLGATVLAFVLALGSACSKEQAPAPSSDASAFAPVSAPAGLAGELVVGKPAELWTAVRSVAGESVRLPSSFELVLATLLGLPPVAAASLDLSRPVVGALLTRKDADPVPAVAVRVLDGNDVLSRVGASASASFESKPSGVPGLTLLLPKAAGAPVLGVYRNHLIFSPDAGAIESTAPYLVRTLAARPLPAEPLVIEVPGAALAGPLADRLRRAWESYQRELRALERRTRDEKGRAADFGDPGAVIAAADGAFSALFDLLGTTKQARLTLTPSPAALGVRLELVPEPGRYAEQTVAELATGDLSPLLGLPDSVGAALLLRSTAEERDASAAQAGLGVERLFGDRLKERERQTIERALAGFHAARGDAAVYGLFADRTLFFSTRARDPKGLRSSIGELGRALEFSALKAPLREYLGDFSLRRDTVEVAGASADRFLFEAKSKGPQGVPRHEALLTERDSSAHLVLGQNPRPALEALLLAAAGGGTRLENHPPTRDLAANLVREVAIALYADAGRLGLLGPEGPKSPAFLALGRDGRSARLDLVLSDAAARALFVRIRAD